MGKLPIGIQIYNLRELLESTPGNFENVMHEVKNLGYEGVELAGLYGIAPEKVRDILKESGLTAVSAHVPLAEMEADIAKVVEDYKTIGVKYIVVPYLPDELRPGKDTYADVLKHIAEYAEYSAKHGLPMLYHNHDFEFYRMPDGEYAFDMMYRLIPAEYLKVEPDTCWIKVAGEDPSTYINRYSERCPIIHLKDFYKEGKPTNMYQLLGVENDDRKTGGIFEFRPIGYGMQDLRSILEAADASCAEWLIVEQDDHHGIGAMEAARRSIEFLKKIY